MSIATRILKVWELDVKPEASWDHVSQETTWMVMCSDIFSTCCPSERNPRSKAGSSPFLENLTSNVFAGHSPLWFRSLWRQSRITFLCTFLLHLLVWTATAMAWTSKVFGSTSIPECCYDYTYLHFKFYEEKGFQALLLSGRHSLGHCALHDCWSHKVIQQSKQATYPITHMPEATKNFVHAQDTFLAP